jgi:large subunit ribosomal protein L1
MTEKIIAAIKKLRESSKKRNFPQTFDLIINLKDIDLKKPENRISEDFFLPKGRGKGARVVVFSDTLKPKSFEVLSAEDIEKLSRNKREIRKLARNVDFFLAEPKLMMAVGKVFGQFLGPRGKMPKVLTGNAETLIESYKRAVRIKMKDSPVIQCIVGLETMKDEDVAENIDAVLKFLETKLPRGRNNIGKVMLKLTMSKPQIIEV